MRITAKLFTMAALLSLVMSAACSSSTEERPNAGANANGNSVVRGPVPSSETAQAETAEANSVSGQSASTDGVAMDATNRLKSKLNAAASQTGPPVDAEAIAVKNARPALENSTFTSYLTDAGYEIRTFRSHPQLLKVVKRIGGDGQSIKIFLRDGRVVELQGNRIGSLGTASSAELLSLAGINAAPEKPGVPNAKQGAKPSNE